MSKSDVLPDYNLEALIQSYASHYVNDDKARIKTFSEYLLIIGKNIFLDTFWESPLFNEDKLLCYIMIWDDNVKKNIIKSLLHSMEFLSFYYMDNLFTTVNINSKYYLPDKNLFLYKQYDPDYKSAILSYMKIINIELHPYFLNLLQYDFNNNINDILKRNVHKRILYIHMLNIQKEVTPETFRNYLKNIFKLVDLKTTDTISKDILTFTHLTSTEQLTSYMMNGMDLILFTAQPETLMDDRIKFWQSIVFPTQQLFSVSLETKSRYLTYFPLLAHYYKSRFIDMILIHWGEFETLLAGIDSQIHYFIARYACELMHIGISWPRFYCTVCEYHIPISLIINDCHQPSFLQFREKYSDFLRRRGLKRYLVYLSNHHCFLEENDDLNSNLNTNRQQTKLCNINVSTVLPTYINHDSQHRTLMDKLTKHANTPLYSSLTKVWKDCSMIECALQQLLVAFKRDIGSVENIVNTTQHFYNYLVHTIKIACSDDGDKSPLIFTVCSHILMNVTKGLAIKEFFSILPILFCDDSCAIPNFLVLSTIKLDKRGLLRLSNLLGCANIQTFLAHNLKYVLCGIMHLVCLKKCSVIQLKALLDSFCKIYHCTMSEFLGIQNGKYLFNYFYAQKPDVWDKFEKLIKELTNTTFIELIASKKQDVTQELFFDCGITTTLIYKSYMYINKIPLEATLTSDCAVPSFIDEKMSNIILGILYRFETVFRKTWTNYFHYKRCLERVCSFIQFMHLLTEQIAYTYKGKLLAIIHTLSFQANVKTYGHDYVMLIIDCIRTLITKLALSGPLKEISIDILMICAWLIEMYSSSSSSMNIATKILAVRDILFDNLDKLYQPVCCLLICNVPPIQKQYHHICLNRIYKDYQSMEFSQLPCHCSDSSFFRSQSYTAANEQGLMLNFERILKYTIQGISLTSYNIKARTCFLINFYGFIKYQPNLNNHLFLYNDTYFELYTHLLRIAGEMLCKTDHDSTVTRNECLKVLKVIFLIFGCFGFIDIKRFPAYDQTDQKSVMTPNQPKFEKFDLLIDLFQILTTYYLNSKESRQQDTLSYAIQEILSIMHENNYDVSALAVKLPNISMIIKYFSASHFSIIDHICMEPIDTCIISFLLKQNAGTNETTNSSLTVSKWANYLASRLIGKLPKSHAIDKIFQICLKISPYNPTLILQVLPYIFLRVITTNNGNLLHEEINGFAQISNHKHQSMLSQDVLDGVKECVQSFVKSIHLFFKWWNYQSKCLNDKIMSSRPLNQPKLKKIRGEGINTYAEQFYHNLNYMHLSQMARLYNPYHSLYFYEIHLKLTGNNNNYNNGNIEKMTDTFKYLSCLYQSINETDYIHGLYTFDVMADTLEQRIFMESSKGNFNECLTLYEQQLAAIQTKLNDNSSTLSPPNNLNHSISIVDTLLLLEQNECAHHLISSLQACQCNWQQNLKQYSDECYLRLGQWEDIELYGCTDTKETSCHVFDILSSTSKDFDLVKRIPGLIYNSTCKYSCESDNPLEIYENLSPFLTYHHVMKDYETLKYLQHSATNRQQNNDNVNLKYFIERLSNSKADFFTRQNIINGLKNIFRKDMMSYNQTSLKLYKEELGMLYLENAKQARKFGYQQIALKNLMQSEPYNLKRFHLEKAKWHKVNNTFDEAFYSLNKCITLRPTTDDNDSSDKINYNSTTILAKAHKLKGQFSQILGRENSEHIIKSYQDAINLNPEWESGYFCLAKYFDELYQFNPQGEMACEYMQKCIQNYGLSIIYGCKHVYQSLPRMISNWLDFGEIKPPHNNIDPTKYQESMKKINSFMTDLIENRVASSTFLLVFSQLLSRICHTNDSVWKVLKLFLSTLLTHHVEKCFWLITAVFKSQLPQRIQRCKEICLQVFANNTRVSKYINDAIQLADKLLEIAAKPIETVIDVKLSREFRYLPKLFENTEFSQILLPIQSQLNLYANGKRNPKPIHNSSFLKNGKRLKQDHSSEQTPTYIFIVNVKDEIEVIQSQQKPKKITFLASDGQFYSLLCKPKDDLRKDFRLMEFNMLVNCCLKQASDSRKRNLSIKTYSAIPLNEDCGLIEWVNHVQPLRTILIKLYQEEGKYLSTKELFSYKIPVTHNKTKKLDAYQKLVKYYSPPIFCEWFRRNFDETSLWYEAKLRYSRSLAVMSMVGYILGLGDRHGENILIDTLTGHILHVDFNCLFNKGLSLEYPEVVEFRLTQNMIDAMGPIRYEGPFRISCEITLKILRDHHDLLMNIIRPFIHDPLLEWRDVMYYNSNEIQSSQILPSRLKRPGPDANSSLTLIKANRHVINIEKRLKGQLNYLGDIDKIYSIKPYAKSLILASYKLGTDDPPLSIQGQVDFLIKQCIDENLLCQMYVGWSPFL